MSNITENNPSKVPAENNGLKPWVINDGVELDRETSNQRYAQRAIDIETAKVEQKAQAAAAHALALKIGVVNATRTDGGEPFPVAEASLEAIRQKYTDEVNEISAKQLVGETLTDSEKQTVQLIRQGFAFFKAVNAALETIVAAGDGADPIESDPRWPAVPGA